MTNTYTTATLVEAELRTTTVFSSSTTPTLSQINSWIEEESRIVELRTGTIYTSTVTTSTYTDYDGAGILRFNESPLLSINKVEYNIYSNGLTPSWIELEEGFDKNFISYLDEGEIEFISGQNSTHKITPKSGSKRLRLSYTYGYATTPLEIQRITTLQVAKRVILSLLNSQSNTQGGNIQVGTISITDPSNYGVNWFKSINSEIDSLYDSVGSELKVFRLTRRYK